MPNTKYIFGFEHIFNNYQYTENHLNFNPSIIKTHNGLIFDNIKEEKAFIYDKNDNFKEDYERKEVFSVFFFWLKNTMNYYEGT